MGDIAKTGDASNTTVSDETHVVDMHGRSIRRSTFPPPPDWPEKPLHVSRDRARMEADTATYIALPLIPQDQIPPGWSNDFPPYLNPSYAWNQFYGSMQWSLNERFHIPGRPKLLLYSNHQPDGAKHILIEVEGQYIFWSSNTDDTIWVPEGDPTLEEMLGHVRGEVFLRGRYWQEDIAAELVFEAWHHRAQLSGETSRLPETESSPVRPPNVTEQLKRSSSHPSDLKRKQLEVYALHDNLENLAHKLKESDQ